VDDDDVQLAHFCSSSVGRVPILLAGSACIDPFWAYGHITRPAGTRGQVTEPGRA